MSEHQVQDNYSIDSLLQKAMDPKGHRRSIRETLGLFVSDWVGRILLVTVLSLAFVLGGTAYQAFHRSHVWAPLGDYPHQIILNQRTFDGDDKFPDLKITGKIAAVYTNEDIFVSATKCNNTSKQVTIIGTLNYQAVIPPGGIVKIGEGTSVRLPGCSQFNYQNPVPPEIAAIVNRRNRPMVWKITGTETPVDAHGNKGKPVTWTSNNFYILPGTTINPCTPICS